MSPPSARPFFRLFPEQSSPATETHGPKFRGGARVIASEEPLEDPIDALNSGPRPRPPLKPELDDYMLLNFVGGGNGKGGEKAPSASATSNKPGARRLPREGGGGGDGDQPNGDSGDESCTTEESAMWRGRGNTYNEEIRSRGALNELEPARADGDDGPSKESTHNTADVADRVVDGDNEAHLYPRTLGSSVSVLDEKDAVLRTGGLRFAGEDPIRGRLRATDPFLWMGRLNAETSAISSLVDKANDALKSLDGGSGGSEAYSDARDGRSSGRQRVDRMQDIRSSRKEVVGPSSRGSGKLTKEEEGRKRGEGEMTATQQMGKLGSMVENLSQGSSGDGSENDSEKHEDPGGVDLSSASPKHFSSSSNGAVEQLSSTMSAYSQAVESKRVIAGGVVVEEEEEEEDSEREEHVRNSTTSPLLPAYRVAGA